MSNPSRNGESRAERLTRALQGFRSLLLQDITADCNDPVICLRLMQEFWPVLLMVKYHARKDRQIKVELLEVAAGQAYDLLQPGLFPFKKTIQFKSSRSKSQDFVQRSSVHWLTSFKVQFKYLSIKVFLIKSELNEFYRHINFWNLEMLKNLYVFVNFITCFEIFVKNIISYLLWIELNIFFRFWRSSFKVQKVDFVQFSSVQWTE